VDLCIKDTTKMVNPTTNGDVNRSWTRVDLIESAKLSGEYLKLKNR
jgi:hypothetical protein